MTRDLCTICRRPDLGAVASMHCIVNIGDNALGIPARLHLAAGRVCVECLKALNEAPVEEVTMRVESALLRVVADVKRGKMRPPEGVKPP